MRLGAARRASLVLLIAAVSGASARPPQRRRAASHPRSVHRPCTRREGARGMPEPDGPSTAESRSNQRGGGLRESLCPHVTGARPSRLGSGMVAAGAQHVARGAAATGDRAGGGLRAALAQQLLDDRPVLLRELARREVDPRRGGSAAHAMRCLQVEAVLRQSPRSGAALLHLLRGRLEHRLVLAQSRAVEQAPRVDEERRMV